MLLLVRLQKLCNGNVLQESFCFRDLMKIALYLVVSKQTKRLWKGSIYRVLAALGAQEVETTNAV